MAYYWLGRGRDGADNCRGEALCSRLIATTEGQQKWLIGGLAEEEMEPTTVGERCCVLD